MITKNLLLIALAPADRAALAPVLTRIDIDRGFVLAPANQPVEHVYFLEDVVASIASDTPGKGRTEVGIFGREGVSATFLLLGDDRSPHETFIQIGGGTALRIETGAYLAAIAASDTLRTTLLRYIQAKFIQTAQSAATNAHQRVEARLARWLLMCHDRVEGDELPLTHEFMGMMIAADRSGVTVTLHILEGAGMIRSLRGRVIIRDRAKLIELAGDGYGIPEAHYSRLLVPFGKGAGA